ncbi:MAG: ABC transporter permease [Burkholderiales bacterium]|nr:ABC transporter permease [Burkholderiales bacterium]
MARAATTEMVSGGVTGNCLSRFAKNTAQKSWYFGAGLAALFGLWWAGIHIITLNPNLAEFRDFSPEAALKALPELWSSGIIPNALQSSGYRLGSGLLIAIAIGVPIGIALGRSRWFQQLSDVPFQFLRMISPLSWEPIAIVVFRGWDEAIIFLIAIAAVWPIMFATAAGLGKVDPSWFKVAKNLGARPWHMVTKIVVPAITYDIMTGIRLAIGVGWIVIIPAEFLGVTSGFGYAIQDARESLEYDNLMGLILVIGVVGYILDSACVFVIRRFTWQRGVQE